MSLSIRFLGSGDAFGSGGRMQTCMLGRTGDHSFLMDCGASSLIALRAAGIPSNSISTIFITHLHGDHFGGLPFVILDGQFSRRTEDLVVVGPAGIGARVIELMEIMYPGSSTARRRFAVKTIDLAERRALNVGEVTVTPFEVRHSAGLTPYALRVEAGGRVFTYSGDTEWTDALIDASRDADLFVCECSFFDRQIPTHLDHATLKANRARLECKRMILTHMDDEVLARLGEVEFETAYDGLEIEV